MFRQLIFILLLFTTSFAIAAEGYLPDLSSPDYIVKRKKESGKEIITYLFKDNAKLSDSLIEYSISYIQRYEELLGTKYPYKTFAVVEDKNPSGYATPMYAVFGSMVLKLPFVVQTSLAHEILHQWFGLAVESDGGNWAEGLTTYLSDHMNNSIEGQNEYRKGIMINYEAYVNDNNTFPLRDFIYNDSKLSQSIGYGKSAMLFHMIQMQVGSERFFAGLSKFMDEYRYKSATWDNLIGSFGLSNEEEFKKVWLDGTNIQELQVSNAEFRTETDGYIIRFQLVRNGGFEKAKIPYTILYKNKRVEGFLESQTGGVNSYDIPIDDTDVTLVIDSDYDIMRRLTGAEKPAVIANILANSAFGVSDTNSCDTLFEELQISNIRSADNITFAELSGNNIVICGNENSLTPKLFGKLVSEKKISQYSVFKNPHNSSKYIMVADNPKKENIRLLNHYGKYSKLKFENGKNIYKNTDESADGIIVLSRASDSAVETRSRKTLEEVADVAKLYPAIFIGEEHTNYAHHLNQLEIIKKLHESGLKIAIGFEMIQKQFQDAADDFIAGKIDELEFIRQTDYHNRWSYDYSLYAPIFRYARNNQIPIIGLNIDGAINKKIAKTGLDNLSEYEASQLPKELNLVNAQYEEDLQYIFDIHPPKNGGANLFNNFFLAQNVWDEVMAESIVRYQKENPSRTVVVIAGSGHSGKNSGIPLRYKRLTGNNGFVIMQDEDLDPERADIMLYTKNIKSDGTPKLGISLTETKGEPLLIVSIDENSPAMISGLKVQDKLLECDKRVTNSLTNLKYTLFESGYGSTIVCKIERKGEIIEKTITLGKYEVNTENKMKKMMDMISK